MFIVVLELTYSHSHYVRVRCRDVTRVQVCSASVLYRNFTLRSMLTWLWALFTWFCYFSSFTAYTDMHKSSRSARDHIRLQLIFVKRDDVLSDSYLYLWRILRLALDRVKQQPYQFRSDLQSSMTFNIRIYKSRFCFFFVFY